MAAERSPMRAPGRAAAIPASSARSVAAMSATSSGDAGSPTTKLTAESATTPCRETARSSVSRSPSASAESDGRPWSTASLTDVQM